MNSNTKTNNSQTSDILRQFINIVTLVGTVIFNTISQIPSFGFGVATNDVIANRYPDNYYFPANAAFSIWGIIYAFLIAFTVYQALPSQRENPHLRRIGYLFAVTGIANCLWIACFQYEQFALSMVMMGILLVSLIAIYLRLGIGRTPVSRWDKLLVHVPFSIYLGWITAATVANASYVLRDLNWNGFGIAPEVWAVVMLAITGVIGVAMIVRHHDIAYALVIAWATYWIASRHANVQTVALAATAVAAVMVIGLVVNFVVNRQRPGSMTPSPAAA